MPKGRTVSFTTSSAHDARLPLNLNSTVASSQSSSAIDHSTADKSNRQSSTNNQRRSKLNSSINIDNESIKEESTADNKKNDKTPNFISSIYNQALFVIRMAVATYMNPFRINNFTTRYRRTSQFSSIRKDSSSSDIILFFRNLSVGNIRSILHDFFFPGIPEHFPFSKKLYLVKAQSSIGRTWDVLLLFMSIWACGMYVAETYEKSYESVQVCEFLIFLLNYAFPPRK